MNDKAALVTRREPTDPALYARLLALGMPADRQLIVCSGPGASIDDRPAAFRFDFYGVQVAEEEAPENHPSWEWIPEDGKPLTVQIWLQRVTCEDAPHVIGEVAWPASGPPAAQILGIEHARTEEDVVRVYGVLRAVMAKTKRGRWHSAPVYSREELFDHIRKVAQLGTAKGGYIARQDVAEFLGVPDKTIYNNYRRLHYQNWDEVLKAALSDPKTPTDAGV